MIFTAITVQRQPTKQNEIIIFVETHRETVSLLNIKDMLVKAWNLSKSIMGDLKMSTSLSKTIMGLLGRR